MNSKIDISQIIKDHFDTLKTQRSEEIRIVDIVVFYGIPLIASGALIFFAIPVTEGVASVLITSLSASMQT